MRLTPKQKQYVDIFKSDPDAFIVLEFSSGFSNPYHGHVFDKNNNRICDIKYRTFLCLASKGIIALNTLDKVIELKSDRLTYGYKYTTEIYILNPEYKID